MDTFAVRRQLPESISSQTECSYLPLPAEKFWNHHWVNCIDWTHLVLIYLSNPLVQTRSQGCISCPATQSFPQFVFPIALPLKSLFVVTVAFVRSKDCPLGAAWPLAMALSTTARGLPSSTWQPRTQWWLTWWRTPSPRWCCQNLKETFAGRRGRGKGETEFVLTGLCRGGRWVVLCRRRKLTPLLAELYCRPSRFGASFLTFIHLWNGRVPGLGLSLGSHVLWAYYKLNMLSVEMYVLHITYRTPLLNLPRLNFSWNADIDLQVDKII